MVVVGGAMVMDFPLDDFRPPLLLHPFSAQIASQASPETVGAGSRSGLELASSPSIVKRFLSLSLIVILFFFLPIIYCNLYSCLGLNCRLVLCCSGFSLRYAPDFLYYALFYMCIVTES